MNHFHPLFNLVSEEYKKHSKIIEISKIIEMKYTLVC